MTIDTPPSTRNSETSKMRVCQKNEHREASSLVCCHPKLMGTSLLIDLGRAIVVSINNKCHFFLQLVR